MLSCAFCIRVLINGKIINLTDSEFIIVQASPPGLPYINELSASTRKFHERQSQPWTAQNAPRTTTKIRDIKITRTIEEKSLDTAQSNADNCYNTGNTTVSNVAASGRNYSKGCSSKNEAKNRHAVSESNAARTKTLKNPVTVIQPQTKASTRSNRKNVTANTETSSHRSINSELFDDDYEEFSAPVVNVDALYSQEKIGLGDSFTESAEITFEGNRSDTESEMCHLESRKLSRKREHYILDKSVNKNPITDHQIRSPVTKKSRLSSGSTKRNVKSIVTYSDSDTESNISGGNKRQKIASSQITPATKTTESLTIVFPEYNTQPTVKSEPLNQGGE